MILTMTSKVEDTTMLVSTLMDLKFKFVAYD